MNYSPILAPVVALVAWTLIVMLWMLISRASFTIRENNHAGALPPCNGSCAVPVRARMGELY